MTIAGSDSSGGAGAAADIKTFAALGLHGALAITAVTAQNHKGVLGVHPVPPSFVLRQIEAVFEDMPVAAVKTGMMAEATIIEAVAETLSRLGAENIVVDPVMTASAGGALLAPEAVETMIKKLFPMARVVTPNSVEAGIITGVKIDTVEGMIEAARRIGVRGPESVVITGGHVEGEKITDVLYFNGDVKLFERDRLDTPHTHGGGCSYSAALAAGLASGKTIPDAAREAGEFIAGAIAAAAPVGKGIGPVDQGGGI